MIELDAPDWWIQVPMLAGPSIRIREVEAADAAALMELFSDPRVNQHLYPPPSSVTKFEGFIEWAQRQRQVAKCVCFVVVPSGLHQPIGLFQLRALDREFQVSRNGVSRWRRHSGERDCSKKPRRSSPSSRSPSA